MPRSYGGGGVTASVVRRLFERGWPPHGHPEVAGDSAARAGGHGLTSADADTYVI
jgi:hypothetical protein